MIQQGGLCTQTQAKRVVGRSSESVGVYKDASCQALNERYGLLTTRVG